MTGLAVQVVLPADPTDPHRRSGGDVYDQRVCRGLRALGWSVEVHGARGTWPRPDADALAALSDHLDTLPPRSTVVVDGLVASTAADVLVPRAGRLRLVVLVHLPLGVAVADPVPRDSDVVEHEVLEAAAAVITTSRWTRRRLLDGYGLWPGDVHVAEPGVDPAEPARGSPDHANLLCAAAVVPHKGQDLLLAALAGLRHLPWRLLCAGPLDRDPTYVEWLRRQLDNTGLADRVRLVGPLDEDVLDRTYAASDLLVQPSRTEAYGLAVTEALARAIPVVATHVGGLPEALGHDDEGGRPGALVPPEDVDALGSALEGWLTDEALRKSWRRAAGQRRQSLPGWGATADRVASVLARVGD